MENINNPEQFQEAQKVSVARNALTYGVLLGVAIVILDLLFYITNVNRESPVRFFSYALMIGGIVMGILNYRNQINGGFISYGKSLSSGLLAGVFGSVIFGVYYFIFVKFIDPGIIAEMIKKSEEQILERYPDFSEEQIEQSMKYMNIFMNPVWLAITTVFSFSFMSFLFSLIISGFTMKKDNSFKSNFN